MQPNATMDRESPVPGDVAKPAKSRASSPRPNVAASLLAKLLSGIRGDKYMVDAYPPGWHGAATAHRTDDVSRYIRDRESPPGLAPPAPPGGTLRRSQRSVVMRDRHVPRLCSSCQAPMASSERSCWRCGTEWASEVQAPTEAGTVPLAPAPGSLKEAA